MQLGRRNLQFFSSSPPLRCEMLETHPPFHRADFLSGTDYGRDRLIRARCWLGWLRHLPALSCDPRTIHARNFAVASDSRSGLIMGDSFSGSAGVNLKSNPATPLLSSTRWMNG